MLSHQRNIKTKRYLSTTFIHRNWVQTFRKSNFVDKVFQEKLFNAAESIIQQIDSFSAEELNKAIPPESLVPGDDSHYHFLAIDFGICRNESGELEPQLIELQAFPSLLVFNASMKKI